MKGSELAIGLAFVAFVAVGATHPTAAGYSVPPIVHPPLDCERYRTALRLAVQAETALTIDERSFHYSMPYAGSQRDLADRARRLFSSHGCA